MREAQLQAANNSKNGAVIVVGGSAAGLLTAAKVAAGGREVRVLDAKAGLDPAPRSLIVTHHFREQLRDVASSSIINEIRRFELFTDGRSAEVALRRPDLIIERARLIPALATEARKSGAKLSFDSHFLGLAPNSNGLRLDLREHLVKGFGEEPDFILFQLLCPHRIVLLLRDDPCRGSQTQNRLGYRPLQP